jgi:hypothetical protein
LNTFKELGLIETYLEENFADQISFKSIVSAALDELVRNSFDQLVKEEVKTSVLVEIIIAECGQWGIKIKDFVGTLDYVNLQKNFSVYKNEKVQIDRQTMGAGVGLGLVMSLAHRLYVIVKKNVSTEIFFIYDPKLKVKRSFQYFEL